MLPPMGILPTKRRELTNQSWFPVPATYRDARFTKHGRSNSKKIDIL